MLCLGGAIALFCAMTGCAGPNSTYSAVSAQIAAGESGLDAGAYDQAYGILDGVAKDNPRSERAMLSLGDAYFAQGAYLKARTYYQRAIGLGAKREGGLGVARVQLAQRDYSGSQASIDALLKHSPGDIVVLNLQGVLLDAMSQHAQAQQVYRSILAVQPDNKAALNNLALSLMLTGAYTSSYTLESELYRSNRNDDKVRQNLSLMAYLSNEKDEAMALAGPVVTEEKAESNFKMVEFLRR
ncbi:tetratricopeptide repeat protein [Martelella alba]|nr:tetratricopeptide repeat protein [Martelella alba]